MNNIAELKKLAAIKAVEYVRSGMIVGLGTGSTTKFAVEEIGAKLKFGELQNITAVPTSEATADLARSLEIPLSSLSEDPVIDLTIDGADEVDENLNLIKGGGGALLREKIVAQASKFLIIIVDESKMSKYLGEKWGVPIEVIPFALETEKRYLESIGGVPVFRKNENNEPFVTDEKNFILDVNLGVIENPAELAEKLEFRAGIVEHGLFINLADSVITAAKEGIVENKRS
jgi:ribose 5-phosphate isomerase A